MKDNKISPQPSPEIRQITALIEQLAELAVRFESLPHREPKQIAAVLFAVLASCADLHDLEELCQMSFLFRQEVQARKAVNNAVAQGGWVSRPGKC